MEILIDIHEMKLSTLFLLGEFGGPFTYKQRDQHILFGVSSWVVGKQRPRYWPYMYSQAPIKCGTRSEFCRVSDVRDWIDRTMDNPIFCRNSEADYTP